MGKATGFMEYERLERGYRPVEERVKSYDEFSMAMEAARSRLLVKRFNR